MSDALGLNIPLDQRTTVKEGSVSLKKIDKLPPEQQKWAANVMRALGLKSTNAQARTLVGAINSAAMVEQTGLPLDRETAKNLKSRLVAIGKPPWDAGKAMEVGAAKVQLDLLSIPPGERQPRPLGGGQAGVNQAYWIDRRDPDGVSRASFLCKPAANLEDQLDPIAPSGGPKGGEVAREALAGRAAEFLAGSGIDIGMPETHVVRLDGAQLGGDAGTDVTCSVQEFRASVGDLKGLTGPQKGELDPGQIAGLAIFDTITLNTDRHAGNILRGADGSLIPIDHGESFAEPNENGLGRLKATLGGPHNALLSLPGAHEPLPKDMAKKLAALDLKAFAKSMTLGNAAIGTQHPSMADAVSDGAVNTSKRAAAFVKMAAKRQPPLSAAAIQIAMGNATDQLFAPDIDEPHFLENAKAALDRVAPQLETLKTICTAPDVEWNTLKAQAEGLGWTIAARSGAPDTNAISDPLLLLQICAKNIRAPAPPTLRAMRQRVAELQGPTTVQITPEEAMDKMVANRFATIQALIRLADPAELRVLTSQLGQASKQEPAKLPVVSAGVLAVTLKKAIEYQRARLTALVTTNRLDEIVELGLFDQPPISHENAAAMLAQSDPVGAAPLIDQIAAAAARGAFIPEAARLATKRLRKYADIMLIGRTEADLVQGFADAANGDPFAANDCLLRLKARAAEFGAGARAPLIAELDELTNSYAIDPANNSLTAARTYLNDGDLENTREYLSRLRVSALSGSFAPAPEAMRQLAAAMHVPDDDPDFQAASAAAARRDERTAKDRWASVKRRHAGGEFGADGLREAQEALTDLTTNNTIPPLHADLVQANGAIAANNIVEALFCIGQLRRLAAAGAFA